MKFIFNVFAVVTWIWVTALCGLAAFGALLPYVKNSAELSLLTLAVVVIVARIIYPRDILFPPTANWTQEERDKFYRIM